MSKCCRSSGKNGGKVGLILLLPVNYQLGKTLLKGAVLTKGSTRIVVANVGISFAGIEFTKKSW
jgi:hypothetical protein